MNEKGSPLEIGSDQAFYDARPVIHPRWCDPNRCTASLDLGGEYRSTPTQLTMAALIGTLDVTASIVQSHAAWLTEPYIMVEFTGLLHGWLSVFGSVELTRNGATSLARLLAQVADTAESSFADQVADYLSTLSQRGRR